MLVALVRYDQYDMPYSCLSFSQKEWEKVTSEGKIDYSLLRRMLRDDLLIMKVLLTVLSIKESDNEYKISFECFPDVEGHMDYAYNARFDINLTVMSGVIRTNRLYYVDHSNTFQSFWPSFCDEQFILNTLEDRRHFLEFPLLLLDDDEQIKKLTLELKRLANLRYSQG